MGVEADRAAREFTASIASVYRFLTHKVTISKVNADLPGLDQLLKQKQKLRYCGRKSCIQPVQQQFIGSRKPSDR
jgi:hypothetical protein